jgi:hypothetical protein
MISTTVESLVSCNHTNASVEGLRPDELSVPEQTPMKVHVEAFDCDGRPINYTRSDLEFSFGGTPLAVTWNAGSNHYAAHVPSTLTAQPGQYELIVSASSGWDGRRVTECVLHRRTIDAVVVLGVSVQMIALSAFAGAGLVILAGAAVYVVRKHRHRVRQLLLSLLRREALLVYKIVAELFDIASDSTPVLEVCPGARMLRYESSLNIWRFVQYR